MKPRAVVLVSGGLDSAVALYTAIKDGYDCHCLTFDYGQRHKREISAAMALTQKARSKLEIVKLSLPWKGSSLLDRDMRLPLDRTYGEIRSGIPTTYVPARNTIFLSIATSFAEAIGARKIFIGAHFEDSSGYPDCRKGYLEVFNRLIALGTKAGVEGKLSLAFPLIDMDKAEIIKLGASLRVPFQHTWSCYKGLKRPCQRCDSCVLRARGFRKARMKDPLLNE